jgi:hypothetical protein
MISDELRPYVDDPERDAIDELSERLLRERPVPRAGFRAELRAQIGAKEAKRAPSWRPKRLGLAIAAYASSGFVLLAAAALGLAGAGPLGY